MQTGNLKSPSQPLFGFVDRGGEGESGLLDETKPMLANEHGCSPYKSFTTQNNKNR